MAEKRNEQPLGKNIQISQWKCSGIEISHATSLFHTFTTFPASNDKDLIRLHFGLKGDYRFTYQQLGKSFDLAGGHHNIMYSKGIDLEIENKTLEIETFGINFPKEVFLQFIHDSNDLLKRFADEVLKGNDVLLSPQWGTVDTKIHIVIDEIIQNPYSGQLQEVFLMAKSLELLVLCVDNYKTANSLPSKYIKNQMDKEKIIAARDFINERITSPPTLSEIAKHIGLNEFKLKNGFKEVFQSTVFGYLTERRLDLAKQWLTATEKTAAQIANDLGYSSPQHFNQQFRNKFGFTPNSIRNNP